MKRLCLVATLMASATIVAVRWSTAAEYPSIEQPTKPACKLVLEDAKRSGTMVDVADFRGSPVVLRGMCPE